MAPTPKGHILFHGIVENTNTGYTYELKVSLGSIAMSCSLSDQEIKEYVKKNINKVLITFTDDLFLYFTIPNMNTYGIMLKGYEGVREHIARALKLNLRIALGLPMYTCSSGSWILRTYSIALLDHDDTPCIN
ncbi:putative matrix protein [Anisopteromalus calandrae negative-strand RNA virus 1]|uniref:Matrix protein n=1 Tax=Anisopteromalus calandrae negative-strand RNA virus 1 TaxID=2848909 RepID=A0AAE7RYB2_9MONO|nr:putative matrix protein [Anisopteromalus calandrae negative-strand RNA virus 1]QWT43283.1 putative matrix protein [Anisopteromalus calandrae negative-strand RNA virus 1]